MSGPLMGLLIGLLAGTGLLAILAAVTADGPALPRRVAAARGLGLLITRSGIRRLTVAGLLAACAASALVGGVLGLLVTSVPVIGSLAAVATGLAPLVLLRRAARRRLDAVQAAWPDAVDALVSGIRAGMSLDEALSSLGSQGPPALRAPFADFGDDLRATGTLGIAFDALQRRLADPTADRVVTALRIARDLGGTDVGRLLRELGSSLREEARMRGEIAARQSWTVSSARVAVAAPWLTVALLCTRPEAAAAYRSSAGLILILAAASVSVAAYLLMTRIARMPAEPRFLS